MYKFPSYIMILFSSPPTYKSKFLPFLYTIFSLFLWFNPGIYTAANTTDESKKIRYSADTLEGGEQKGTQDPYKQLNGNVIFVQESFTIYADTAQYYDKQGICYATGNLKMQDREGGVMVADEVIYNTKEQMAELQGNVSYIQDDNSFDTQELQYFVKEKKCVFHHGATLIQKDNQITSEQGSYSEKEKLAIFIGQVKFTNLDYTVDCDRLAYNTQTKFTEFIGDTQITTKDNQTLVTPIGGAYNAENKSASFHQATIFTEDYSIYGHLINADQKQKYYTIDGNIKFISPKHDTIILGEHSYYDQEEGVAEIYGHPILEKTTGKDPLYIVADKFKFIEDKKSPADTPKDHIITAFKHVRIYNSSSLQGKAKCLEYHSGDSTVHFYDKPVFWSNGSQITAENISLTLNGGKLEKMHMDTNALLVSEANSANYNQIRGKEMTAYFMENTMQYIDIEGNGESIFFITNADEDKALVGMNFLRSSHIRIDMKDNTLSKISFFVQPRGNFYPPQKITKENSEFENFVWRIREQPELNEFLAIKSLHDQVHKNPTKEVQNGYI